MKNTHCRGMLLIAVVFVFSCLLLSGGSRLIASPDKPAEPVFPRESRLSASLTCPARVQTQELHEGKAQESRDAGEASPPFIAVHAPRPPQTDANGNILRQTSYMRAVYQAFALGDGFA